jgi:hypothetical protein
MKTILPDSIKTIEEATNYLTELFHNGEDYHPDDDATDVCFCGIPEDQEPTHEEQIKMNELMDQICDFEGFDPCGVLMDLWYKREGINPEED